MTDDKTADAEGKPAIDKDEILQKTPSAYEAIVAIAREARRLNSAPGVFLEQGEKPIPRAVRNFVDGKVEYVTEEDWEPRKGSSKKGRDSG